jgi:hypothetical protein
MSADYEKIKKDRRLRRFLTYVAVYGLLWLAFRTLIEVFRGGDITNAFSEILWTGIVFGLLMGIYSIFKKQTIYINAKAKNKAMKVLSDLNFNEPKVYKSGKMLFVREAARRFTGHDEVFMTNVENLVEIECEKAMKLILEEKLEMV